MLLNHCNTHVSELVWCGSSLNCIMMYNIQDGKCSALPSFVVHCSVLHYQCVHVAVEAQNLRVDSTATVNTVRFGQLLRRFLNIALPYSVFLPTCVFPCLAVQKWWQPNLGQSNLIHDIRRNRQHGGSEWRLCVCDSPPETTELLIRLWFTSCVLCIWMHGFAGCFI